MCCMNMREVQMKRKKHLPHQPWKTTLIKALKFWNYSNSKLAWIAGTGFLGGCFSVFAAYQYHQYQLRTSEFQILAIKTIAEHKKFLEILGPPVTAGHVFSGTKTGYYKDNVSIVVPITGKNAEGLLKYKADKIDDKWKIRSMEFTFLDEAGGVLRLVKNPDETTKEQ